METLEELDALYEEWCKVWHRDPEDTVSMVMYEEACLSWMDENCRQEWQNRGGA